MDANRIVLFFVNDDGGSNIPIRTLYVSPVNVDMGDQIKCYFERFGTVNSVKMKQEDNAGTLFALVEFKKVDAAAAVLLSLRMHRIGGCDVQVRAAELWYQPDHILNALNDDCLRLILLGLNQKDLTNAANVCVRFNEQAKLIFSTKFKKLDLTQWNTGGKIEDSFKAFGSVVQSIDVPSRCFHQYGSHDIEILPMIAQYCTTELKNLTFRNFGFEKHLQNIDVKFDSVLSKLERLIFINCYLGDSLNELVSACVDLKFLHIERCHQNCIFWPEFSALDELRLVDNFCLNSNFINDIISLNPKLKKVSFIEDYHYRGTNPSGMIQAIVENCTQLLELEFGSNYAHDADFLKSIRCLSQLKFLKVLKLKLNGKLAAPLCAIQSIDAILKMKHLKVLELSGIGGLTDEQLILLAKGVGSQLETLQLEGSTAKNLTTIGLKKMLPFATKLSLLALESTTIIIDADDYKAMLATVQKRQGKDSLLVKLTGKGDQVGVNESVLMKNRDIFYIEEKKIVPFFP